ncbi:MAG: cadherin repeat domain-containing protein, partial [Actinomycetia bacterium]|nr:cadherin repeat domain-containing protein [Actinomycetes bacterium]
ADGGAFHVPTGPSLGTERDFESDGQPNTTADGDDSDGLDDEDGVVLPSVLFTDSDTVTSTTLAVDVQNASADALLSAWVDFNADGDWDDAGEQIFTDQVVSAGINNLTFDVPAGLTSATTYARFRLSTAGGLGTTGVALDGEVEDYQVDILDASFPIVSVAVTPTSVFEDDAPTMEYTFTRSGDIDSDLLVHFSVAGTADFSADYTPSGADSFAATTGSITILSGNTTASLFVDPVADILVEGDQTVSLTVTADANYTVGSPDMATGTITDDESNADPVIADQAFSVAENQTAVDAVVADDADLPSDTLTFSITGNGADDALFDITSTGVLTFAAAPDFESPADNGADNEYLVEVRVQDTAGGFDTAIMTVSVTDVNEAPTVALQNTTTTLAESADTTNRIQVADIVVTDDALGTNTLSLSG